MGVKSKLTLKEAQQLFADFHLTQLLPTTDGVMDTTYIANATTQSYIIKKYERDIASKIAFDTKLLNDLRNNGLNVPKLLAKRGDWYLYTKLEGESPKRGAFYHLQILGSFVAKLHRYTKKISTKRDFFANYPLQKILSQLKTKHFYYYKQLASLPHKSTKTEGFIHGDIFKDNTLFKGRDVALFDFIDGGDGSFAFELGVILLSFNPSSRRSYDQILLQSYNQHAPRKIRYKELQNEKRKAAKLYALLRINHYQNIKQAKKLAKLW